MNTLSVVAEDAPSARAIERIIAELHKAETKHPGWPDDVIHAVGILTEETGEAMQAAIDITYAKGSIAHLKTELAQAGAMAVRALVHLERGGNQ